MSDLMMDSRHLVCICLELVGQQGEQELSAVLVDTDFFFCTVF